MTTSKKKHPVNSALVAVAFQDHLSRQYSIIPSSTIITKARRHRHSGCGQGQSTTSLSLNSNSDGRERVFPSPRQLATVSDPSPRQRVVVRAPQRDHGKQEYVLDKPLPPLTLAQGMGLVDAPRPLLKENEWEKVKVQSSLRHDSSFPCPICQEEFGLRQQVLLSCSHVFHLTCLKSFERFSRCKRCPLCRSDDYQSRVICDGAQHFKRKAATIIQSAWRGYVVRKWYSVLRERLPPNNPALRKKHFEKKFSRLTDQLVKSCDPDTRGVESVLSQADVAMETSRNAIKLFDAHHKELISDIDWRMMTTRAVEHVTSDCAVCLVPLHHHHQRPLALLSCGHLLHCACIEALEHYSLDTVHLCPLCRCPYLRRDYANE